MICKRGRIPAIFTTRASCTLLKLGTEGVAGTRPGHSGQKRLNQAFLWTKSSGARIVHTKQYFPDEEGYYEKQWFQAGPRNFRVANFGGIRAVLLICTELMFNEHARRYGRKGANVILVPRAVGKTSLCQWLVAAKMAAIVSGAYVLSSNRRGMDRRGQEFGGRGNLPNSRFGSRARHANITLADACDS